MTDAALQAKTGSEHGTAARAANTPADNGSAPAKQQDVNKQHRDGPQLRRGR